jgi:hypothetical protein
VDAPRTGVAGVLSAGIGIVAIARRVDAKAADARVIRAGVRVVAAFRTVARIRVSGPGDVQGTVSGRIEGLEEIAPIGGVGSLEGVAGIRARAPVRRISGKVRGLHSGVDDLAFRVGQRVRTRVRREGIHDLRDFGNDLRRVRWKGAGIPLP